MRIPSLKQLATVLLILIALPLLAQEDPVQHARAVALSGDHATAISLLEQRLAAHPEDDDARTLLGIVLSWDRQFDRARRELQTVLSHDARNADALAALENVEKWSSGAPPSLDEIQFLVRADAVESGPDWRELQFSYRHQAPRGAVVGRISHATRSDDNDTQSEIEFYPRLRQRTYAYLAAAVGKDERLYPRTRLGAEIFHGFGTWEVSAGDRWLAFSDRVNVATASASKYVGNWLFTLRGYKANGDRGSAGNLMARRYFGDGSEYWGVRVGRGSTREEIRSEYDLAQLNSRDVVLETRFNVSSRSTLELRAGAGKQNHRRTTTFSVSSGWKF